MRRRATVLGQIACTILTTTETSFQVHIPLEAFLEIPTLDSIVVKILVAQAITCDDEELRREVAS